MDLLPTVMDLAGVDLPEDRELDGESVLPHLLERTDLPDRQVFFGYEPKLGTAMRSGHWKMQTKEELVELYDLSRDVQETTNVAEDFPERTARMLAAIAAWKAQVAVQ